jgi:hypothetical protein
VACRQKKRVAEKVADVAYLLVKMPKDVYRLHGGFVMMITYRLKIYPLQCGLCQVMSLASISASTGKVNQTGNLRHDVSFFEDNKLHPASIQVPTLESMENKRGND